jgi:hypothetical protein
VRLQKEEDIENNEHQHQQKHPQQKQQKGNTAERSTCCGPDNLKTQARKGLCDLYLY